MLLHTICRLTAVFIVILLVTSMAEKCNQLKMNNSTTLTILRDIRNAFKTVTNNTGVLNNVIPEMYDLTGNRANSIFVFKIPHSKIGYSMLWMQRSDFVEPTFPNLTAQYMDIMKKRRRGGVHEIISKTNKNVTGTVPSLYASKDDWSLLGLNGWTGEVSQPIEVLQNHHNNLKVDDSKYATEIESNEAVDKATTTIVSAKLANTSTNAIEERQLSNNIYIARVNDPFGYSTNWKYRNASSTNSTTEDRSKRDVIELYSMIRCSTGCEPLKYKGYGCYCGFLGAGVPVNGIDRCCKLHDKCYEQSKCTSYLEYFVPYLWKCYRRKPLCAIDHGEWGGPQSCAARLCYCDLRLSRCLQKFTCPRRRAVCTSSTARQLQNLLFFK